MRELLLFLALAHFTTPVEFSVLLNGDAAPSTSLTVRCSPHELPPFCASRFCSSHGLSSNVEGVNCQQLISDEIVSRGGLTRGLGMLGEWRSEMKMILLL